MDRIDRSLTITLEHPFDRMAPFSTFRNGMFSGEIDEDDYSDNKDKDTDMSEKFGTAKVILDSSKMSIVLTVRISNCLTSRSKMLQTKS